MSYLTKSLALVAALMLAGCLDDTQQKDPDLRRSSSGSQSNPSFYASTLGNTAVATQAFVVNNPEWFEAINGSRELNLANLGIAPSGLPAPVRSYICPTGSDTEVIQFTWLDAKDANGRFALKGAGSDAGSFIKSLIGRATPSQVGSHGEQGRLQMSDGTVMPFPTSCSTLPLPLGAPVLAFRIERPAAPINDLAKTEYRTVACGDGQVGTMVQSRTVTYLKDGTIQPSDPNSGWATDNIGQCMNEVIVTASKNTISDGASTVLDMANLEGSPSAQALGQALVNGLKMDCVQSSVVSEQNADYSEGSGQGKRTPKERTKKSINTCKKTAMTVQEALEETDTTDHQDERIMSCGRSIKDMRYLPTLPGVSTVEKVSGDARARRWMRNSDAKGKGGVGEKDFWLGTEITCKWDEKFHVNCNVIPGEQPPLEARISNDKWISTSIAGFYTDKSFWSGTFGACWLGCTKVQSGTWERLNPDFFTGVRMYANSGTETQRDVNALGWLNKKTFVPKVGYTPWVISKNECVWGKINMIENCPTTVDPALVTTRAPSVTATNVTALNPGTNEIGVEGDIYRNLVSQGYFVSRVTLNWKKCPWQPWKSCNYYSRTVGPTRDAYIKAWPHADGSTTVLTNKDGLVRTWRPELLFTYPNQIMRVLKSTYLEPQVCARVKPPTKIGTGLGPVPSGWEFICSSGRGLGFWGGSLCHGDVMESRVQEYTAESPHRPGTWSREDSLYRVCNYWGCRDYTRLGDVPDFLPNGTPRIDMCEWRYVSDSEGGGYYENGYGPYNPENLNGCSPPYTDSGSSGP